MRLSQGPFETLWAEETFAAGDGRPSGSGIPLLFPFAGRIQGTTLRWQDREYELPAGDGQGNAIHGFVLNRAWRVTEQTESRVVGEFQAAIDDPSLLHAWPADFRITATYEVKGNQLAAVYELANPGDQPLPFGFGTHPYFRVPLAGSEAAACRIHVPTAARWELIDLLATGRLLPLNEAIDLGRGLTFGEMHFDDVFTDLAYSGNTCEAEIHDPNSGHRLVMRFDDTFRECVVYNPPHREAVCIEPYTCVPGAFDLSRNNDNTGLRILEPGETLRTSVTITCG